MATTVALNGSFLSDVEPILNEHVTESVKFVQISDDASEETVRSNGHRVASLQDVPDVLNRLHNPKEVLSLSEAVGTVVGLNTDEQLRNLSSIATG